MLPFLAGKVYLDGGAVGGTMPSRGPNSGQTAGGGSVWDRERCGGCSHARWSRPFSRVVQLVFLRQSRGAPTFSGAIPPATCLRGGTRTSRKRFMSIGRAKQFVSSVTSPHGLRLSGSPPSGKLMLHLNGEMSEWLKEHAWKACVGETLPWVRIPLSPPSFAYSSDFPSVRLHGPLGSVLGVGSIDVFSIERKFWRLFEGC